MAKSRNRIGLEFEGFEDIVAQLDSLEGDVKKATEESLKVANQIVAERLTPIMENISRPVEPLARSVIIIQSNGRV